MKKKLDADEHRRARINFFSAFILVYPRSTNGYWRRWLILGDLALIVIFAPLPVNATNPVERTFHIQASQFEYTPGTLALNPGDHVTIELTATDVVHGLAIDGYNIETTADPGQTARLSFVADRQGSFRFRCTTTCGNLHPFMIGKLNVGQNDLLLRAILLAGLALFASAWGLHK